MKGDLEARSLTLKTEAAQVAAKLDGKSFTVLRQASEAGQLFGSVSPRDLVTLIGACRLPGQSRSNRAQYADQDDRPAQSADHAASRSRKHRHRHRRPQRRRGRTHRARRRCDAVARGDGSRSCNRRGGGIFRAGSRRSLRARTKTPKQPKPRRHPKRLTGRTDASQSGMLSRGTAAPSPGCSPARDCSSCGRRDFRFWRGLRVVRQDRSHSRQVWRRRGRNRRNLTRPACSRFVAAVASRLAVSGAGSCSPRWRACRCSSRLRLLFSPLRFLRLCRGAYRMYRGFWARRLSARRLSALPALGSSALACSTSGFCFGAGSAPPAPRT